MMSSPRSGRIEIKMNSKQDGFKMVLFGGPNDGQKCYAKEPIIQMRVPAAFHFDKEGKRLYHTYRLTTKEVNGRAVMVYRGLE